MLYTNLKHIETANDFSSFIQLSENAVVVYGRMDLASVTSYRVAESLVKEFKHVNFFDMELDNPEFNEISILPKETSRIETPATLFFKKGTLVNIEWGIPTKTQLTEALNLEFPTVL